MIGGPPAGVTVSSASAVSSSILEFVLVLICSTCFSAVPPSSSSSSPPRDRTDLFFGVGVDSTEGGLDLDFFRSFKSPLELAAAIFVDARDLDGLAGFSSSGSGFRILVLSLGRA